VRKLFAVGTLGLLVAVAGFGAVALAATPKVLPKKVVAHVHPPHRLGAPYKFTVSGKIVPPPFICPAGVTNKKYCSKPPKNVCVGKVAISIRLGVDPFLAKSGKVIQVLNGKVGLDCKYSVAGVIAAVDLTATLGGRPTAAAGLYDGVYFKVKYLGSSVLLPSSANTQIVIAKLTVR
jgi:hypothetical protein